MTVNTEKASIKEKKVPKQRAQAAGQQAIEKKGWLGAHKWLILRRISQLSILALFLAGPLWGVWIVKGNMASSLTLDILPLSDPYVMLQALMSGNLPTQAGLIGAIIVLAFYLLVGGRVYCSWMCPVNIVTDAAGWMRRKLGLKVSSHFARSTRYWLLGLTLILPPITGAIVWELFNPVSLMFRGIIFGMGWAWMVIIAIFLFDLFVSQRGWCGHLCPVGAFYSLLAAKSLLRVSAVNRDQCDDCNDCFVVCPEPKVIRPALKGAEQGLSPLIDEINCTNCGRCIDICDVNVFEFTKR
ncbi:MAG: quinol dehydrogenase ferredoxin subunit NapH [gamma proteobacterium symbiont of Taylorina sp.]|nr:quinol dehydrogenase ferredoxin subunit NapH [gamma proteobacterium symbiont of Taylorina sp.]